MSYRKIVKLRRIKCLLMSVVKEDGAGSSGVESHQPHSRTCLLRWCETRPYFTGQVVDIVCRTCSLDLK